jgi:hypothetical protein
MAGELGSSQLSTLLETLPGIASVLRSPVADALVNMIRAGAGTGTFKYDDADELIQYAVRRSLLGDSEGEALLDELKSFKRRRRKPSKGKKVAKAAWHKSKGLKASKGTRKVAPVVTKKRKTAAKEATRKGTAATRGGSVAKKAVKKKATKKPATKRTKKSGTSRR